MINPKDVKAAVAKFRKMPGWRKFYDNAPPGAKEHIRLTFLCSTMPELSDGHDKELLDWKNSIDKKLKPVDWEYLIEHAGTNSAAGMAKQKYRERLLIAKDREVLKREKQSGTRLIKELRKAYRDWDAGRITTKQYNDEAHRIEDIESRLETAGMIGENTAMRFHDVYGENAQAVNDIFGM